MRVLITGASGFAGKWLSAELAAAGHEPLALDEQLDIRDRDALMEAVARGGADAIAHLAAVSFAPDATGDPGNAYSVAIRGTANVMEAAESSPTKPPVLVVGSSEVYGAPLPDDLPITETHPLRTTSAYGLAKIAQESVALALGRRYGVRVAVVRPFNHIGPGQRPDFVVPALANRIRAATQSRSNSIAVGNLDVRRDFTDVRDVVRAYRLLIELLAAGDVPATVVNVASGQSVAIRSIAETFSSLAGADLRFEPDPKLVRANDPPEIRGDYALLAALTGWRPEISIADSLGAVWAATAPSATPISGQ